MSTEPTSEAGRALRTIYLPIVGAHFRPPAKLFLELLPQGAALTLRREPENPHDPNAIAVEVDASVIDLAEINERQGLLEAMGKWPEVDSDEELTEWLKGPWHLGYVPRVDTHKLLNTELDLVPVGHVAYFVDGEGKPKVKVQILA